MRTFNRNSNSSFNNNFDRNFKRMNVVFWVFFAVVTTLIFTAWGVMGYVGYQVATDPQGAASFLGNIAADALRPVVQVIKE
jgi:hypothetical protein|tara:strand:- start:4128 stop:4370 length:243 start_codon:yes stop_codon:yes gene_type:complete